MSKDSPYLNRISDFAYTVTEQNMKLFHTQTIGEGVHEL